MLLAVLSAEKLLKSHNYEGFHYFVYRSITVSIDFLDYLASYMFVMYVLLAYQFITFPLTCFDNVAQQHRRSDR